MKGFLLSSWLLLLAMGAALTARGATILQDDFEAGSLSADWSVSATNNGRAVVSAANEPASGDAHLVLDDSISDAIYSVSEATLNLDLTNKRNVVLRFKAKSLGNEPHTPPAGNFVGTRAYDGVAISTDGGTTWRSVQSLDGVPATWTSYFVTLDSSVASLGGVFGPGFRIRFSAYDNAPAPLDGIAIDDVSVTADEDQRLVLELPRTLGEGTGPHTGYALLSIPSSAPIILNLSASPAGQLSLPASVTIPPGETFVDFNFSVLDDELVNLTRNITVTASALGASSASASISITDNDVPVVTLTLPAELVEGVTPTSNATITLDRAPSVALTFTLSANPTGELTLPSTVTFSANQTVATFTVRAIDDTRIDGNINVTVTANASGVASATAVVTAIDNETRTLSMTLPSALLEGGSGSGTVSITGTLASPLEVSLTSANEAALAVPATVTIAAGQTSATFTATAVNNAARDGTRTVAVSAAATGFTNVQKSTTIRDDDVSAYRFNSMPDLVNIGSPLAITVSALDVEGNVISPASGTVELEVVLPDSSTQSLTPASVTLGGTGWSGNVMIPAVTSAPLRLRARDNEGNTGDSASFDLIRSLALPAADLIWDPARNLIYASVPSSASSAYANKIVAINPATLQITASVTTNQNPGRLALTSGGEALYVVLNANGAIARIDPAAMTLTSTFAVGTDPSYGTLYAADICTVAGQPNLLIVSQYRKGVSPSHNGVAVYENGVRRANKTQDHTGSNIIEPSSDPAIYFGYNTESTEYGFRRLKLDANGMTQLDVDRTLFAGFSLDMRSEGDKVFSTSGVALNGAQMKRLGTFGTTGLVCPDLASNRVFYFEASADYSSTYNKLAAYDPTTFTLVRRLTLSETISSPASFIRWGSTGLAFRNNTTIYLANSSQLVPNDPPADLEVTIQATPNPATAGSPLIYTVQVTNQGPNPATNTLLTATLSDSQAVQAVVASAGTPTTTGLLIKLPIGNLAAGASTTLTISTLPQSAGSLSCTASATTNAVDGNFANNFASKLIGVGYVSGPDVINQLRLSANNLLYDSTRNLLWVTIPSTVAAPLGKTIVSINPTNGYMSDPIPINGSPITQSMALSANGRYLYVGLNDVAELHRVDLASPNYTSLRVPLGLNGWGSAGYGVDIEVLDGDGTSVLVTTSGDESALVIDGTVRRANRTGIYTVNRVERTATPGVYVGYDNAISSYPLTRLSVSGSGVAIIQTVNSLVSGFSTEIRGAGNIALSSGGQLVNSGTLTLISNLGATGRPCMDGVYSRAFLVAGNTLRAFDSTDGTAAGSLTLPTTSTGDWALGCVRWGVDGFAILGSDKLFVGRWTSAIPANSDTDNNRLADAWEARNFNTLSVNNASDPDGDGIANGLEYLMGTSPTSANALPVRTEVTTNEDQPLIHVIFPRRQDVAAGAYAYECSADLSTWSAPASVTETVIATQMVDGIQIDTVDAAIPFPDTDSSIFVRVRWQTP